MGKLASLVVDLQVQTAELRKGLDEANRKLDDFGEHAGKIGHILSEAFDLEVLKEVGAKLGEFVVHGAEVADHMGKLAQASGSTVEEFSKLSYAANLSEVSTEQLAGGLEKLSKKMGDALAGGKEQAAAFKALGVSITDADGKLRNSSDVFADLADRFSHMEDGAAKTALAIDVFGKSGAELIPVLNKGADGLKEAGDEAQKFGLIVTKEGAAGAEKFNESLTKLKKIGEGLAERVAQKVAPAFSNLADELLNSKDMAGALDGAAKTLSVSMRLIGSAGAIVAGIFKAIGAAIGAVASAVVDLFEGNFTSAMDDVADASSGVIIAAITDTYNTVKNMWSDPPPGPGDAMADQAKKTTLNAAHIVKAIKTITDAERLAEEAAKSAAATVDDDLKKFLEMQADEGKGKVKVAGEQAKIDLQVASHRGEQLPTFKSFDDALANAAISLKHEVDLREQARIYERDGNYAAAKEALLAADGLHSLGEAALRTADTMKQAFNQLVDKFAGRTGKIQGLIQSATMGAQAGGAYGAIAAVAVDLLSQSSQFQSVISQVDDVIGKVADSLGTLLGPALQALGPILNWVGQLFKLLEPLFKLLGVIIQGVMGIATGVLNAVSVVINGIIDAIDFILGWAGVDLSKYKMTIIELTAATADQATATNDATKAEQNAADAFTNVPQGYRTALAMFNATNPGAGAGGVAPAPGTTVINNVNTTINAGQMDPDDLYDLWQRKAKADASRRTGRTLTEGRFSFNPL
jgi:hypothetical protein